MKKVIYLLIFTALIAAGCGKNNDNKPSGDKKTESNTETKPATNTGTETKVSTNKDSKTGSNDLDAVLDEYEQVVTKYVDMSGKITAGDAAATKELTNLAAKQLDLSGKLESSRVKMTPKQLERYSSISLKLAENPKK